MNAMPIAMSSFSSPSQATSAYAVPCLLCSTLEEMLSWCDGVNIVMAFAMFLACLAVFAVKL